MRYGSRASARTIHCEIVLPKFLELNGPNGTYSHACMSRALQSFSNTYPKTWDSASSIRIGSPILLGVQRKQPSSSSMSRRLLGENVGCLGEVVGSSRICPLGRRMGVPEITILEARP